MIGSFTPVGSWSRILCLSLVLTMLLSACGGVAPPVSWPSAVLDGEILYVANNSNVYALNAEGGTLSWQFPQDGVRDAGQFFSGQSLTDSTMVVGSFSKKAFALEKDTGREIWRFSATNGKSGSAPTAVSAANGVAYLSTGDTLYALNSANGQQVWSFQAQEDLWAAPVVDGERLYQTSMDHNLYAIDVETGAVLWSRELDGALPSEPTLVDGVLYLGAFVDRAYAIDAGSGRILWYLDTEGWVWGSLVVVSGVAYFGDLDGVVYAVRASNGRILWRVPLGGAVRGSPAVVGETLFVNTENGFVYSLSIADGGQLWRIEVDSNTSERLLSKPVVRDGLIFVTALGGESLVYAYNQDTGLLHWQFNPGR